MGNRKHGYSYYPLFLGFISAAVLIVVLVLILDNHLYRAWIIAFSLTTFALVGIDKALAIGDRDRIPENVLHLFTLLGGFAGQLAGRLLFHHKTNSQKHPAFNFVLVLSFLLWAGLAYLLFA